MGRSQQLGKRSSLGEHGACVHGGRWHRGARGDSRTSGWGECSRLRLVTRADTVTDALSWTRQPLRWICFRHSREPRLYPIAIDECACGHVGGHAAGRPCRPSRGAAQRPVANHQLPFASEEFLQILSFVKRAKVPQRQFGVTEDAGKRLLCQVSQLSVLTFCFTR